MLNKEIRRASLLQDNKITKQQTKKSKKKNQKIPKTSQTHPNKRFNFEILEWMVLSNFLQQPQLF